jgi:hypothetical protein
MNRLEKESYFQQEDKHQISLNESKNKEEGKVYVKMVNVLIQMLLYFVICVI